MAPFWRRDPRGGVGSATWGSTCDTEPVTPASWLDGSQSTRAAAVQFGWPSVGGRPGMIGYLAFGYFMNERPGCFITADLATCLDPVSRATVWGVTCSQRRQNLLLCSASRPSASPYLGRMKPACDYFGLTGLTNGDFVRAWRDWALLRGT